MNQLVEKHDGVQCLASDLKTNLEHGINGDDKEDILQRHEAFGTNTYPRPPTKRFYRFMWEALKDPTIIVLLVCAALSLGFGIRENGLKEGNNIPIDVVRNGRRKQVLIFEIVVGDVVCLKIGDPVPAYELFIDGHSLQVDESCMTGESERVEGVQDENGNMKVDDIIISVVGIVAAAVTIVVVVIPEVLPLAVTLTLAYSMKRMMAGRAMVRKLSAYETMGSATDICTVKMGTLTLNQMQGTKFWLG
ncbi:Calcium-transporting ATPase 10, plasma membrane-type [Camellia lanceoleosa]|uniref:Calcium-transporting ATPase 10, plasma membrane-type n=1 Tax=Camellia lanceoleosa TaxID=1840588 RepID=A0ACC0HFV5_9ERIC|nr:Calcium-transporting ATPase 10, plasma membrane-type [Camellia lanceoleosa]